MSNKLMLILTVITLIVGCALIGTASLKAKEVEPETVIEETVVLNIGNTPSMGLPCSKIEVIEEMIIFEEEPEFPIAVQVWKLMKSYGWSDAICAGIIGNMMQECGGSTLNLNPYIYGDKGTSYGLCQWHNGRKDNLLNNYGAEIEDQIEFLVYELGQMNIFSNPEDHCQVAYDFCVYFERPANAHIKGENRKELAEQAFRYFVGK